MTQSFLTLDSMDRSLKCDINWKAVKQYFTVVLFVCQLYAICNFGECIDFRLGRDRSESVN